MIFCVYESVLASKIIIAIDASTSMRGFFVTGKINNLVNQLKSASNESEIEVYCYKFFQKHGRISGNEFKFNNNIFICSFVNAK